MNVELDKIKNSVIYLAENIPNLYYTKLLKLLYYFDFISVLETGKPVTKDVYFHLPYGPVPSFIKDQLEDLKPEIRAKKKEIIKDMDGTEEEVPSIFTDLISMEPNTVGFVIKAKTDVKTDKNQLSKYQFDLLDAIILQFKDTTTKQLVAKVHAEAPYSQTIPGSIIDYKMAFHLNIAEILPKRTFAFSPEVSQTEFFNQ